MVRIEIFYMRNLKFLHYMRMRWVNEIDLTHFWALKNVCDLAKIWRIAQHIICILKSCQRSVELRSFSWIRTFLAHSEVVAPETECNRNRMNFLITAKHWGSISFLFWTMTIANWPIDKKSVRFPFRHCYSEVQFYFNQFSFRTITNVNKQRTQNMENKSLLFIQLLVLFSISFVEI